MLVGFLYFHELKVAKSYALYTTSEPELLKRVDNRKSNQLLVPYEIGGDEDLPYRALTKE